MKYIIPEELTIDFKSKIFYFLNRLTKDKNYFKIKKYFLSYLKVCFSVTNKDLLLQEAIFKNFKFSKKTFYNWAIKFINSYKENNINILKIQSTKPKKLNLTFSKTNRKLVTDLYFSNRQIRNAGVTAFYHLFKQKLIKINYSVPKNLKTFYRWLKQDPRWSKYKQKINSFKKEYHRYEVSDIGLLQMDAKHFPKTKFPVNKNYYVYDFIDEKTRIVFGYVYENLAVENAINAVKRAIIDFKSVGIKIKRIRTDNGSEFTNHFRNSAKFINSVLRASFSNFLEKQKITHELTPIRSPQSNGKIERFHRNYQGLFYFKKLINLEQLQELLNEWYLYYNFQRPHSSLKHQIPINFLASNTIK